MKKWLLCWIALTICLPLTSKEWTNWLGNQSCSPKQYHEPKTLYELCDCIRVASGNGCKIRVVGGGYSISDLVNTNGCLVNLKNFNQILSIDPEKNLVRVEAGITIRELNEQLSCYGLALSNQAAIDNITLGGALATAVHGTGHTGTLSSFVRKIDLVLADGSLKDLSPTSDNDAFAAARVSLGALGVIYAITIQCEPLFYLKADHYVLDIDTLIEQYEELNEQNHFFQFAWNVESGKVLVDRWNRCTQTSAQNNSLDASAICYKTLTYYTIDENDKDLFSEIAIPIETLPIVLIKLKQFIRKYQNQGIKVADIVVRFVEADENVYLSPATGHSAACMTMSIPIQNSCAGFYEEFEELMLEYQGRPHWGKCNFLDYEKAQRLYGKNLEKFISVKQRLDPQGVFSNAYIDRICGVCR